MGNGARVKVGNCAGDTGEMVKGEKTGGLTVGNGG